MSQPATDRSATDVGDVAHWYCDNDDNTALCGACIPSAT